MSELSAGREMDAAVAVRVMGLRQGIDFGAWPEHDWQRDEEGEIEYVSQGEYHSGPVCARCHYGYCRHCDVAPRQSCRIDPSPYSTSIYWAWQVVERTGLLDHASLGRNHFYGHGWHWEVRDTRYDSVIATGETAAEAICRAAPASMEEETG